MWAAQSYLFTPWSSWPNLLILSKLITVSNSDLRTEENLGTFRYTLPLEVV